VESILEGREEKPMNQKPENKSKTNSEKKKTKPYSMLRQKSLQKLRQSGKQRKNRLSKHIEKKNTANKHRRWHNKAS